MDIAVAGEKIDELPVFISYRIIDLFSGHLYSNPAKAIEELVVNAYDAFAHKCHLVIPDDLEDSEARIIVWDDGESMDLDGLKELWMVAETRKRDPARESLAKRKGRLPIGKFGIGKLASYVVGHRISHICKKGSRILAVTMDFSKVIPEESEKKRANEPKRVTLTVRKLNEDEAEKLLSFATSGQMPGGVKLPLFGVGSSSSWTLVVVDHLRSEAKAIAKGRLRWIISTALPLVPDFRVFLNGDEVAPSKLAYKVLRRWIIGKNDKVAKEFNYETGGTPGKAEPLDTYAILPNVGKVSGEFTLYEDTLLGGKAEEVGRSHGYFIMVRRRLVNHDDPLFGIHVLSHATFNRFRAVVYADDLDKELVASRESISEESRAALERYLVAKFNEVRGWYEDHLLESTKEEGITDRLAAVPGPLARFPIKHAIERAIGEKQLIPRAFELPKEGEAVVDTIKAFELLPLESTDAFAKFDASSGTVKINVNHPYYVNYSDYPGIEAFAAAEVLLEAYLYESSLAPNEIRDVLEKRDQLLRGLVRERPRSVLLVAQQIRDSGTSETEMETGCHRAFRALGFEVQPLGGSGKSDGLATAILAVRYGKQTGELQNRSYKVSYDAKSTGHDKVKSADIRMSTVARHRDDYGADYAAVIGPDFETAEKGEESKAVKEARRENVTLIRANDLADIVSLSGVKPLSLSRLEELFKNCRSPDEAHSWLAEFRAEPGTTPDLRRILERIYRLQKENPTDPPSFGAVKHNSKIGEPLEAPEWQIKEWLTALSRLLPDFIYVYEDRVEISQKPDIIVAQFEKSLRQIESKFSTRPTS